VALTVTDVRQSQAFYTDVLGFQHVTDFDTRALLSNDSVLSTLTPAPDPAQAIPGDRFNEDRVGLDHLSLSVGSMGDLKEACTHVGRQWVVHGEIKPLEPFGIAVLAMSDPDNIQVELTAPLG
jgi:catechol 2,3-dioxygenase-like lactoylglutathione lyase family enzyme